MTTPIAHSPLGKKTPYISKYSPQLLYPIPRSQKRSEIGVPKTLPFKGFDTWNAFELSWLNDKGKPLVAVAQFDFPCESPNLIESKSLKLYLNSLNNTKYQSLETVFTTLKDDLSRAADMDVQVAIHLLEEMKNIMIQPLPGECIDNMDIECNRYLVNTDFLSSDENEYIEESISSNLLKSNCLVTGQPDWGSVNIQYAGPKIDRSGLLKYIVSYRNHNEFHEQCVERIFMDIFQNCKPKKLTVHARYTRRGGLDINPIRSTEAIQPAFNARMVRQ